MKPETRAAIAMTAKEGITAVGVLSLCVVAFGCAAAMLPMTFVRAFAENRKKARARLAR